MTMRPSNSPDRSHSELSVRAALEEIRQPDRCPGTARHTRPRDDGSLPGGHHDGVRPAVGDRHRPLEHVAHSGVDLGAHETEGLAERLGHLQEELVHRHCSCQTAAKGAQHFVGRLPRPVDETSRGAEEAPLRRDVADGGHGGRQHGQPESLAIGRVPLGMSEAKHDHEIDGGHDHREADDREQLDEEASRPRPEVGELTHDDTERDADGGSEGHGSERLRPGDEEMEDGDHERRVRRHDRAHPDPLQVLAIGAH
jgi:hypothetical protein